LVREVALIIFEVTQCYTDETVVHALFSLHILGLFIDLFIYSISLHTLASFYNVSVSAQQSDNQHPLTNNWGTLTLRVNSTQF